ncbi:MAG: hypothetical protein WDW36_003387 [Sanguina aurantia]
MMRDPHSGGSIAPQHSSRNALDAHHSGGDGGDGSSNGSSSNTTPAATAAAAAAASKAAGAARQGAPSQSPSEQSAVGLQAVRSRHSTPVMAAALAAGGGGPVEWWQQLTGGGGGGGGGGRSGGGPPLKEVILTLASFAVTKLAYVRLTKRFREEYARASGVDVRFRLAFAGSGVQARAVIDGLPADIVALALPLDIEYIVTAGLIAPTWPSRHPNRSVVCETTAALVVRPGNPKNILSWEDLLKPGVRVVMANPKTAGVARWIFLALWGHRMRQGDAAATAYVTAVMENVLVQPRDAREASDVFYKQKVGDVLLTYENEVTLTNEVYGDAALPYVVPSRNIRIECPVSMVDGVVLKRGPDVVEAATAFLTFLFTAPAQREFANVGFRANAKVSREVAKQQVGLPPTRMWEVDKELGGWTAAQAKFFNAGCILDQIQTEVGHRKAAERARAAATKKA